MNRHTTIAWAATAALSATAGWALRGPPEPAPATPAVAPARTAAPTPVPDTTPLIVVASDGNATLRVEQQPLEWVLEQIAQQSGWSDVHERVRAARPGDAAASANSAAVATTVACASPAPPDAAAVLRAVEQGSEAERLEGLMNARAGDLALPEPTLRRLIEHETSERVRAAAFESWLERRGERTDALRRTLEAALYLPSAAIRGEAMHRLSVLQETERLDALPSQGGP